MFTFMSKLYEMLYSLSLLMTFAMYTIPMENKYVLKRLE